MKINNVKKISPSTGQNLKGLKPQINNHNKKKDSDFHKVLKKEIDKLK